MTARIRRHPQLTFFFLAVIVNAAASMAASRRPAVAAAAVFDMTVTVTAIYYWLMVRPGLRPKSSLIFIAMLGLLRASFAFPKVIPGGEFIAAVFEIVLIAGAVALFRLAGADPVAGIREALGRYFPFPSAARAIASEVAVLYYAFAWRARPHVPAGAQPFTIHRASGVADLMMAFAPLSLIEIVPVHLLAAHWSSKVAWILTGLGVYGAVWILALGRSFALRPCYISEEAVVVRFGILFSLNIARGFIAEVRTEPIAGALKVGRSSVPNLYLGFSKPLKAERFPGFAKTVWAIAIACDAPIELNSPDPS